MWYYIDVVYGRSFNRTSLELKQCMLLDSLNRLPPFNRTSLELKHASTISRAAQSPSAFNRTSLELKLVLATLVNDKVSF